MNLERVANALHHRLLALLIGVYALASTVPGPGLWMRSARIGGPGGFNLEHGSLTSLLLSLLLFQAGIGVRADRLAGLARHPRLLGVGLLANLFLPVAFILATATTLRLWHNPREVQEILVGLALIASMPIAGSSTAWAQNADADLALSVGLVVLSTCVSPISTPLVLHAVGWAAAGNYATTLHHLAAGDMGGFLAVHVLAPSLVGIATRRAIGERRAERLRPALKLASTLVLLLLCYANAAVALPDVLRHPDWDLLAVMGLIVASMCSVGFAGGRLLGRIAGADPAQTKSLMFGLGMSNNGTGLVIAAGALSHMPAVMLPMLFYNLIQHVVASIVDRSDWIDPPTTGAQHAS